MLKFNVKLKGIDKGEEKVIRKTQIVLMKSMFKMEELAVDYAPFDRGYLKLNIRSTPLIPANKYVLLSKALYSAAMEEGTRPFYAPIKPLKDWARRKLGDENIGYAVQKKIAREGIKAQPFMRPAYHEVRTYWFSVFWDQEFGTN